MVCLTRMAARKISRPPARAALVRTVTNALDDMKAVNVKVLDVRQVTDVSDCMVLASGNSDRHVRSIADRVVEQAKARGFRPIGVEGQRDGEWVLVDLNDVLVHVMLPRVREFYGLEELWEAPAAKPAPRRRASSSGTTTRKKTPAKSGAARMSAGSRPAARGAGAKTTGAPRAAAGSTRPRAKASSSAPRTSGGSARGAAKAAARPAAAAAPARRAKKSAARGARSRA